MTNNQGNILIGLTILIIGWLAWNNLKEPTREKWEYKIQAIQDAIFDDDINTLGKQGWELVFARRASSGRSNNADFNYEIIFKRKTINK